MAQTFGSFGGEYDECIGMSAAHVGPVLAGPLEHEPRADVALQDDVVRVRRRLAAGLAARRGGLRAAFTSL